MSKKGWRCVSTASLMFQVAETYSGSGTTSDTCRSMLPVDFLRTRFSGVSFVGKYMRVILIDTKEKQNKTERERDRGRLIEKEWG